ncbi:MAG: metallophosphoesterase [Deltaproteobacteria bacterium]|nr:metallophosphoesterase [Deltaproteobacteria bacterium]
MRFVVVIAALAALSCATEKPVEKVAAPTPPPPPDHPRTWAEVPGFYGTRCPPPPFVLDEPLVKTVGGARWTIKGSSATREGRWSGPLTIGVLGAVKDAADDTKANLVKAKAAFDKAKVDVILCNGDVAETAEIHDVAKMLGDVFGDARPILVHSGNSEWTGGFTDAFADAEKVHPAFFNLNFIRDLDFGGVHFVSLPGWSVKDFVKEGGCRYKTEDVDAVRALVDDINKKGELPIITAHGPPRGPDKKSLDATHDFGNVGDQDLAKLLQDGVVKIGIFGHILEAGGRATDDPKTHKGLALPMKKGAQSLFVNVGSASSVGISMLDKKTSRGMAAIVVVDDIAGSAATAKVTFLPLRR